jgi:hypothetical protein
MNENKESDEEGFLFIGAIMEEWKEVEGANGAYRVSNTGRVWSRKTKKILRPGLFHGYKHVRLYCDRKGKSRRIHVLVLEAFVGPRPTKYTANHKNFVRTDNRLENLEWLTHQENLKYSAAAGRLWKSQCNFAKLNPEKVKIIREMRANGVSGRTVAERFGVCMGTILLIHKGKTWKHVT